MIYGIGHDLVEIERVQRVLGGGVGDRFMRRILTPAEWELPGRGARPAEFVAGRFAAKEAVSKAFGCGIGQAMGFTDIEVLPDPQGKPCVRLSGPAWERLGLHREEFEIHLSITHERHLASAYAILERVR